MACFGSIDDTENSTSPCDDVSPKYRPLPSQVINFIAESICGTLDTYQPRYSWDFIPLPELVFFVKKVTTKAKIDVHTAIAALILVGRFKQNLPRNAHGEYGTTHKIFLSALLIASKEFMSKSQEDNGERPYFSAPPTRCPSPTRYPSPISDELSSNTIFFDNSNSHISEYPSSDLDQSQNILSTTPLSITSSMMSEDDIHDMMTTNPRRNSFNYRNRRHSVINQRLADISEIYNIQDVNQMEREFLGFLSHNIWVSDRDIREFVENNKYALGIC